jgi:hypothetical protein
MKGHLVGYQKIVLDMKGCFLGYERIPSVYPLISKFLSMFLSLRYPEVIQDYLSNNIQ